MDSIQRIFSDPLARSTFFEKHKLNIISYTILFAFILFVYHFLSDGDFSFLLTLGAIVRSFGFSLLLINNNSISPSISLKTLQLYILVFISRLSSILFYEGYLPFDSSGDWLYQATETTSLALTLFITYSTINSSTYNYSHDSLSYPIIAAIILASFTLALLLHPSLNKNIFTDTLWTFAAYLETLAVLPQFYLLQTNFKHKPVETWTAHFVFCLGLSRLFLFVFWLSSFHELSDKRGRGFEGYAILATQIIHLAIMAEFCFYYLLAARTQTPLIIPNLQV